MSELFENLFVVIAFVIYIAVQLRKAKRAREAQGASEQLPEFIARPLLYNPLLHAIQHMRSAYFEAYESLDVSILYAFFWALGLVTAGLVLEAAKRSRA